MEYETVLASADDMPAHAALVDPDDPRFLAPEHMPDAINGYLREWRQSPLQTPAAFARCIMESLVLRYGEVLRQLQRLTGNTLESVHVLGGGARNTRLNQWLADAFGTPVIAGPTEATALGNTLMQLVGLGNCARSPICAPSPAASQHRRLRREPIAVARGTTLLRVSRRRVRRVMVRWKRRCE